jgi:type II secretory pathway component PulC
VRTLLIRLLIITLAVYAGVQLWYGNVEKRLQPQAPPETTVQLEQEKNVQEEEVAEASPVDERKVILQRNIFQAGEEGAAAESSKEAESDIDQLEKTQLSLSLLGTVSGEREDARAIIRDDKTRLEDLFRVGSEIQGAIINRIARGKVVLLVNGREEVLVIKDRDKNTGPSPIPMRQRTPVTLNKRSDEQSIRSVPRAVPRRRISFRSPRRTPPRPDPRELIEAPLDVEPGDDVLDNSVDDAIDDAAVELEPTVPLEEGDVLD